MSRLLLILIVLLCGLESGAQSVRTTPKELLRLAQREPETVSSVYRAYPEASREGYHVAPEGYEPVFISHYGRHGSRFLTEDSRYTWLIDEMEHHPLTRKGEEMLKRVRIAQQQAKGRGGDLTPTGEAQHRGIAQRMAEHFPTLFVSDAQVKAYSSTSRRCMMSMMAFCEALKEHTPQLTIQREASERNMAFINYESDAQRRLVKDSTDITTRTYNAFRNDNDFTKSFLNRLFKSPKDIQRPYHFMEQMYLLAQDMQDCGRPTELLSFFAPEELVAVWRVKNLEMYLRNGDSPLSSGLPAACADNLLNHIIQDADLVLRSNRKGATLRFGHDTALLKLLSRMHVQECNPTVSDPENVASEWQDYNLAPMAANLQLIFYRNTSGHTIVRLLLNENEVHLPLEAINECYYEWTAVKHMLN